MGRVGVYVRVHMSWRFFLKLHAPKIQTFIGVCDFLGVGRPRRRIIEGRRLAEIDLADLAEAALIADMQVVFARLVGEIGDKFSVGRPRGITFDNVGRVRQIADIAFLGRHRQYLSANTENRASAGRRDISEAYSLRLNLLEGRPDLGKVAHELDG